MSRRDGEGQWQGTGTHAGSKGSLLIPFEAGIGDFEPPSSLGSGRLSTHASTRLDALSRGFYVLPRLGLPDDDIPMSVSRVEYVEGYCVRVVRSATLLMPDNAKLIYSVLRSPPCASRPREYLDVRSWCKCVPETTLARVTLMFRYGAGIAISRSRTKVRA